MAKQYEITTVAESITFHFCIGEAIAQWAYIERALFMLANLAFDSNKALAPAFHSVENFRSKLAFVDRALQTLPQYEAFAQDWMGHKSYV